MGIGEEPSRDPAAAIRRDRRVDRREPTSNRRCAGLLRLQLMGTWRPRRPRQDTGSCSTAERNLELLFEQPVTATLGRGRLLVRAPIPSGHAAAPPAQRQGRQTSTSRCSISADFGWRSVQVQLERHRDLTRAEWRARSPRSCAYRGLPCSSARPVTYQGPAIARARQPEHMGGTLRHLDEHRDRRIHRHPAGPCNSRPTATCSRCASHGSRSTTTRDRLRS